MLEILLTYPGNKLAPGRQNKCIPHTTFKTIDLRGYKQYPADPLVCVLGLRDPAMYIPLCSAWLPIRKMTLKYIYIEPGYVWPLITGSPQDCRHKYCICITVPAEITLPSFQPSVTKQTCLEERGHKKAQKQETKNRKCAAFSMISIFKNDF